MRIFRVILSIFIITSLLGCSRDLDLNSITEWNFLIYMAADNNLERYAIKNIESLQKIGSSQNVNIFGLMDI